MQKRGRKVVPWFQTAAVLSFSIVVACLFLFLIFREIENGGDFKLTVKEVPFVIGFMAIAILLFTLIKRYYFNTNKHISYLEEFYGLPLSIQKKYKFFVLTSIILLPFLLIFIMYVFDKRVIS